MKKDLVSAISLVTSINPAEHADGTVNGTAVNLTGADSAVVVFQLGALGDGAVTFSVQESVNGSTDWADIPSSRLQGTLVAGEANTVQVVGVNEVGGLRKAFIRPVMTVVVTPQMIGDPPAPDPDPTGVTGSAVVIKGNLTSAPAGSSGSIYIS